MTTEPTSPSVSLDSHRFSLSRVRPLGVCSLVIEAGGDEKQAIAALRESAT